MLNIAIVIKYNLSYIVVYLEVTVHVQGKYIT